MKRDYVHMRRDTPLPLCTPVHILVDLPLFPSLRTYLMGGLFLNQKTNKNIRLSYTLKYNHSKKNSLRKTQQYNVSYALHGGYLCKEKLLLSC